jgi:hypothetical protein
MKSMLYVGYAGSGRLGSTLVSAALEFRFPALGSGSAFDF